MYTGVADKFHEFTFDSARAMNIRSCHVDADIRRRVVADREGMQFMVFLCVYVCKYFPWIPAVFVLHGHI